MKTKIFFGVLLLAGLMAFLSGCTSGYGKRLCDRRFEIIASAQETIRMIETYCPAPTPFTMEAE